MTGVALFPQPTHCHRFACMSDAVVVINGRGLCERHKPPEEKPCPTTR